MIQDLRIRTGVDLVALDHFLAAWRGGGPPFERRLFHPSELGDRRPEHLAGIFAIKEAVAKALDLPAGSWLDIEVVCRQTGKPEVRLSSKVNAGLLSWDVSLSHNGDYAIATCVVLCNG